MTDPTTQERLEMLAARRSASTPRGRPAKPPAGNTRRGHPAIGSRIAVAGFGATATLGMVAAFTLTSNAASSGDTVAAASTIEPALAPATASTPASMPTTTIVAQEPIKLTLPPTAAQAPVVTQAPRSADLAAAPAPTAPPTQSSGS